MENKRAFLLLVPVIALVLYTPYGVSRSQAPEKWQHVTVCDLVKDHGYNGVHVTFRAKVLDGQLHGILLKDNGCDKGLRMIASDAVRKQEDYTEFLRKIYLTRKSKTEHTITADFYGKFVYRPSEPRLKWALDVERISNIQVEP